LNAPAATAGADVGPWRSELLTVVRAVSGGLLFGVPLLYTMEVWWIGSHTTPAQTTLLLAMLAVPVFALNQTDGFRASRDVRVVDAVADTVEAVAIGIVVTAGVLVLLREVTASTPIEVALGKVLYESVPFCLGVGVARHFLGGGRSGDDGADEGGAAAKAGRGGAAAADLGATAIGAVFISLSIAPTDEVPMIASAMSPGWLLTLMAASLLASYAIVFVAGFTGQDRRQQDRGALQHPITETVVCYLMALTIAAALLWLFQRDPHPSTDLAARVVILGFPAAVGGAAGRLAI
jgi:putative integral membrane protein (TIGR02587 family)